MEHLIEAGDVSGSNRFEELRKRFKKQGLVLISLPTATNEPCSPGSTDFIQTLLEGRIKRSFEEDYELGEIIGKGLQSIVQKCYRRTDRQLFAVKVFNMDEELITRAEQTFPSFLRMCQHNHPSIMRYHAQYTSIKRYTCYRVVDYAPYPDLSSYIYRKRLE